MHRERIRGHEREEKAAWVSGVLREWGSCGRVVSVDESVVGHLLFAPAVFLPGSAAYPTAPVSQDAVLLATGYVDPAHRGGGLGRIMIQSMAKDLLRGGDIVAIEAIGATRPKRGRVHPAGRLLLGRGLQDPAPASDLPADANGAEHHIDLA